MRYVMANELQLELRPRPSRLPRITGLDGSSGCAGKSNRPGI